MADYKIHLSQAQHNEKLAKKLVYDPPFHDWGITAAFYAAIHYVECWLFNRKERHTETSIPTDPETGKLRYSPHTWREILVKQHSSKTAFKSFRKLRDASETARYLSLSRIGQKPKWTPAPTSEYFKPEFAQKLVEKDLAALKTELQIAKNGT